jgi:hypothetical protein
MTDVTAPTRDIALDAIAGATVEVSLHSAQPDGSGSNELSGSGYERQSVDWDPATGGLLAMDGELTYSVPAGDVTHIGLWDSGDVWRGWIQLTAPENFTAPGTYILDELQLLLNNA